MIDLNIVKDRIPASSIDVHSEIDGGVLRISIRDGSTDEPSPYAFSHAMMVLNFIKKEYPTLKCDYEVIDEWVDVTAKN